MMTKQEVLAPVALTTPTDYAKLFGRNNRYITVEGLECYRSMASPSSPTKVSDRLEIMKLDCLNAVRVFIDRWNARLGYPSPTKLTLHEDNTEYVQAHHVLPKHPCLRIMEIHYDGVVVNDYDKTVLPLFVQWSDLGEMELFRIVTFLESNAFTILCLDKD